MFVVGVEYMRRNTSSKTLGRHSLLLASLQLAHVAQTSSLVSPSCRANQLWAQTHDSWSIWLSKQSRTMPFLTPAFFHCAIVFCQRASQPQSPKPRPHAQSILPVALIFRSHMWLELNVIFCPGSTSSVYSKNCTYSIRTLACVTTVKSQISQRYHS